MKREGRGAIITGAARSIGRACAERFLTGGAKLVLCDSDAGARLDTAATPRAEPLPAPPRDVTKRADGAGLVAAVVARSGRRDIMVNTAGIAGSQDVMSITEADFEERYSAGNPMLSMKHDWPLVDPQPPVGTALRDRQVVTP